MEENRIPKIVLQMNVGTTRFRVGPRNRWQHEVRGWKNDWWRTLAATNA